MIERYSTPAMSELWSEQTKFQVWLDVEILACEAWNSVGKIPDEDLKNIKDKAAFTVDRILEIESEVHHDVIAFTTNLAENIGPSSRYVHMGLTSSDVVDTAQAVRMVRGMDLILAKLEDVIETLRVKALEHKDQVMIGRTHGIHAEPTTLGLKFALWYQEMLRNRTRLEAARETVRVGGISGAVGTYAHTGTFIEKYVCEKLGIKAAPITTQVIQRDRHAEMLSMLAVTAATIEKIATEIRNLQRTDIYELEEPFRKGQKGSSAMPHKRNPISAESLTGLARVVRSNTIAGLENVTLWHERDISHSSAERVVIPDSQTVVHFMLTRLNRILTGIAPKPERMDENLNKMNGLIYSQKLMLTLVDKGITREDAYLIVQRNAMKTWQDRRPLFDHVREDEDAMKWLTEEDIKALGDPRSFLKHLDEIYRQCGLE